MSKEALTRRLFVKSGSAMRIFLFNSSLFIMVGIWLTGFDKVHWFIYIIPALFTLSAILGICPGINLWKIVVNED